MGFIMEPESVDMDQRIKKQLFRKSMEKDWDEVVKIYRNNPRVHKAKITRSGDTALHIAVSDKQEDIVELLVQIICEQSEAELHIAVSEDEVEERIVIIQDDTPQQRERKKSEATEVLEIKNERGNTPLHLAASIGNVWMCDLIARVDRSLVGARNDDNETPFFMAALCGHKEAFFCLNKYIHDTKERYDYCRRKDGDTILHRAIDRYHFDLAFQIIHLYPHLVYSANEKGFSPLHQLARKTYAFKSGSDPGICYKMIYNHCTCVDELKQQSMIVTISDRKKIRKYPENYQKCIDFIILFWNMVQVGSGYAWIKRIREKKERHVWSVQIMKELLNRVSDDEYVLNGTNPRPATSPTNDKTVTQPFNAFDDEPLEDQKQTLTTQSSEKNQEDKIEKRDAKDKDVEGQKGKSRSRKGETPILIAAKKGVTEMVEEILKIFPEAIHDMNKDKKNIVLLAVENRQAHVYQLLLNENMLKDNIFGKVDNEGNSALHLAAKLGDKSWLIPGAALQMQWEIKWFEFVKDSMPLQFFPHDNNLGKNPTDIFEETHKGLLESGGNWLNNVAQYCSVVAGLLVTVAYSTSTTVPGGVKGKEGTPILEHLRAFDVFAVWSLLAFYSSLSAVVMFLSILTSGYQLIDFRRSVFVKLLLGLTSLYVSIASTLASFTAGHYFILKDTLKQTAAPVYSATCLIVTMFAIAQFPLYVKVIWATVKKVPDRSYKNVLQYDG